MSPAAGLQGAHAMLRGAFAFAAASAVVAWAGVRRMATRAALQGCMSPPESSLLSPERHRVLPANARGRLVIVGDVHGCADEFELLLEKASFRRGVDTLVTVGDLVNKGPDSRRCVQIAMDNFAVGVRGNHEDNVLRHVDGMPEQWPSKESRRTALSLTADHLRYLASLPLSLSIPQYDLLIVHAGLVPSKTPHDMVPNDLMNMRNVRADGTPSRLFADGEPWAALWSGPPTVVFGHDALRGLQRYKHAIGLDTGCVYGGKLSAVVYPGAELVQVDALAEHSPKTAPESAVKASRARK